MANALHEHPCGFMLHKNPGDSISKQFGSLFLLDPGRHNQHLALKALVSGSADEISSISLPEIQIEKHDIDGGLGKNGQRLTYRTKVTNDLKSRLARKQTRNTLAEQGMIVKQQYSYRRLCTLIHSSLSHDHCRPAQSPQSMPLVVLVGKS